MKKLKMLTPVLVLAVICIVVTGALAATYQVTDPIIKAAQAAAAEAARAQVLPEGTGFTDITADYADELPECVTAVYSTENNAGHVMSLSNQGYSGPITLMIGLKADGTISAIQVLDASGETPSVGVAALNRESFYSQFPGKDSSLEGVETVTSATITTSAYIEAVRDAFTAFDLITGKEGA